MIYGPRERRRRETSRQILAEARRLVLTHGLDGLTVARIAKAVGYTPGALYRYFPSKGALLAAVDREILEGWVRVLEGLDHPEPVASILASGAALARLAVDRREDFALIAATLGDPRDLVEDPADAVHLPATHLLLARISEHVARAAEAGALRAGDADRRAVSYVFALVGILQIGKLARFDPVAFDAPALARDTAADLLVGWGADPAAVARLQPDAEALAELALKEAS